MYVVPSHLHTLDSNEGQVMTETLVDKKNVQKQQLVLVGSEQMQTSFHIHVYLLLDCKYSVLRFFLHSVHAGLEQKHFLMTIFMLSVCTSTVNP